MSYKLTVKGEREWGRLELAIERDEVMDSEDILRWDILWKVKENGSVLSFGLRGAELLGSERDFLGEVINEVEELVVEGYIKEV